MTGTLITPVVDEGLGNSAYLPGGPPDWAAAPGGRLE